MLYRKQWTPRTEFHVLRLWDKALELQSRSICSMQRAFDMTCIQPTKYPRAYSSISDLFRPTPRSASTSIHELLLRVGSCPLLFRILVRETTASSSKQWMQLAGPTYCSHHEGRVTWSTHSEQSLRPTGRLTAITTSDATPYLK